MKQTRIKKLIKQDWMERTFDKKRSVNIWWMDFIKIKSYYKNNEEGC